MDVSVKVERASVTSVRTPLLVVNLFEGMDRPSGATAAVDEALGGLISRLIGDGEIRGSLGDITIVHNQGDRSQLAAERVAVVGLGKRDDLDLEALRVASATAARKARDLRVGRYATIVHGAGAGGLDSRLAARTVVEASLLALYRFDAFKTPPEDGRPSIDEITVVERDEDRAELIDTAATEASAVANAVELARDLSQTPGNEMTPTVLADRARQMAESRGLSCQVWGKDELRERGMNAILAVNSGSAQEPRFVMMRYDSRQLGREDARRGRQGHHLRQRRDLAQAARAHGEHEARHVRRRRRRRVHAACCRRQAAGQRDRHLRRDREPAQRHGLQARRRLQDLQRHLHRDPEHRRRRSGDPVRRAGVRGRAETRTRSSTWRRSPAPASWRSATTPAARWATTRACCHR